MPVCLNSTAATPAMQKFNSFQYTNFQRQPTQIRCLLWATFAWDWRSVHGWWTGLFQGSCWGVITLQKMSFFPTLRVLPILVIADSKAHAEIWLTTAGGHKGCRWCFVSSAYVTERCHYYYGNFQQRYRFPAINRDPTSMADKLTVHHPAQRESE